MNNLVGLGSSAPDKAALLLKGAFCQKAFVKSLHNDANHKLAFWDGAECLCI